MSFASHIAMTIKLQIKQNTVALISLIVSIVTLVYITWSNHVAEEHQIYRLSGFELLKNLGELQVIVNYSYYEPENQMGNPMLGWGHIALIQDLSKLMPSPIPEKANGLISVWSENWESIKKNEKSADIITNQIDSNRLALVKLLMNLK